MPVTSEYRKAVTELADKKEDRRFLNDSSDHAKLLIELMIGRAKTGDEVLIYSGKLKAECYRESLINSSATIRVLLDDTAGESIITALPSDLQNRIECRIVKNKDGNHFFIAGSAMRFELDHDDATAVANFNEPDTELRKLRDRFEKMWDEAGKKG